MIWFYVYKSLSLYNRFLETVHTGNKKLHFVNQWSKEVIVNIIYPKTVNQIYGYLDKNISPTLVRYTLSRYKEINNKKKKIKRVQGGYIISLLIQKRIEEKWLTIYVNKKQHLLYCKFSNKKENIVIVPQIGSSSSSINNKRGLYVHHTN